MPYPTTRQLLNPLILAMLTFQVASATLKFRTYVALNAPETSMILIAPYPTTGKLLERQTKPANYHSLWRMVCFPIVHSTSIRGCVRPFRTRPDPYQRKMLYRICLEITTTTSPMRTTIQTSPRLYRLLLAIRQSEPSKEIQLSTTPVYI